MIKIGQLLCRMGRSKAQAPAQAPQVLAWLGVPHLHRRPLHGGGADASLCPRRRQANARYGKATQSALKNLGRWQRRITRAKLRMLFRKASSTLAPPSGRALATRARPLTTGRVEERCGIPDPKSGSGRSSTYATNFSSGSQNCTLQWKKISRELAGVVTPPAFLRYRDEGRFF